MGPGGTCTTGIGGTSRASAISRITLFKSCYLTGVGDDPSLSSEALVFFRRWKNNRNADRAFSETVGGLRGRAGHRRMTWPSATSAA